MLTHTKQAARPAEKTVRSFGNSLGGLNSFFNELAYKPKGSKQSYLFYLPWLNHDLNASLQPPGRRRPGPARPDHDHLHRRQPRLWRRGELLPQVKTIVQSIPLPRPNQLPAIKGTEGTARRCGPE